MKNYFTQEETLQRMPIMRKPIRSVEEEFFVNVMTSVNGASAPTDTTRAVGASGSVEVPVKSFSSVTEQEVFFEWHVPEQIDDEHEIEFHLMWQPASGWTTGNYVWKLEYLVKDEDATLLAGTPTTISVDVTPSNATDMIETEYSDTISASKDQLIQARFYRDVASDDGDAAGEIRFFEFECYVYPALRAMDPGERIG